MSCLREMKCERRRMVDYRLIIAEVKEFAIRTWKGSVALRMSESSFHSSRALLLGY